MSDNTLPAHIETLLTGLRDDPSLAEGATDAVGELTGTDAAEAAATYYRSNGYEITADELIALEIARKHATGEPLSEHELETVAGGGLADTLDHYQGLSSGTWSFHFGF